MAVPPPPPGGSDGGPARPADPDNATVHEHPAAYARTMLAAAELDVHDALELGDYARAGVRATFALTGAVLAAVDAIDDGAHAAAIGRGVRAGSGTPNEARMALSALWPGVFPTGPIPDTIDVQQCHRPHVLPTGPLTIEQLDELPRGSIVAAIRTGRDDPATGAACKVAEDDGGVGEWSVTYVYEVMGSAEEMLANLGPVELLRRG